MQEQLQSYCLHPTRNLNLTEICHLILLSALIFFYVLEVSLWISVCEQALVEDTKRYNLSVTNVIK